MSSDTIAMLHTKYSVQELGVINKWIDSIMQSPHYLISIIDALNGAHPLSKQNAEALLDTLFNEGWMVERKGRISLGLRGLIELEGYLKSEYEGLESCELCKELVTIDSIKCEGETCLAVMHQFCFQTYFERVKDKNCLLCKQKFQ